MKRTLLWIGLGLVAASISAQILEVKRLSAEHNVVVKAGGYFPVMVRRGDELIAVYRTGGSHVDVRGELSISRSPYAKPRWSDPELVLSEAGKDHRNPAFGVAKDGTLVLAYTIATNYAPDGKKTLKGGLKFLGVLVIRSADGGRTWDEPTKIELFQSDDLSAYGRILTLADGTMLMNVYSKEYLFNGRPGGAAPNPCEIEGRAGKRCYISYVVRSTDNGKSWGKPSLVAGAYNETALLESKGTIYAMARSMPGSHLALLRSTDGGRSFGSRRVLTKDNEHPADLIELRDGRLLLTYGERNRPFGVRAAVLSREGDVRREFILHDTALNTDCGYPTSLELADGRVLTLFYQVEDLDNAPASATARTVIWRP